MAGLFDRVIERAELPRVIARAAMERAVRRAGVAPEALDTRTLMEALPSIRSTLRVYHDEPSAERRLRAIQALGQPTE